MPAKSNHRDLNLRQRLTKWTKRLGKWLSVIFGLYLLVLAVGLIPVNNAFEPDPDGVEIFVVSNAVHADLIVPIKNETHDWSQFFGDELFSGNISTETHIAFGWGDRGFYLDTETWEDFKITVAANALLLPSETCMHVVMTRPEYYLETAKVQVSHDQYKKLVLFIDRSFRKTKLGENRRIAGKSYGATDAFFEANGRYHLFYTCNSWVGNGLKVAGVQTPMLSPLPKTPSLYFPNPESFTKQP